MILEWLLHDFIDLFARDNRARIALWPDAKAEFDDVLSQAAARFADAGLALLAFDNTQNHAAFWLKWAAELGPAAGKKAVIWLPYARDEIGEVAADGTRLEPLREYLYSGLTWGIEGKPPTLFAFLKKHGVPMPTNRAEQDALWRGGPESPLVKYVRANLDRDAAFWMAKTLNVALIEESIVGNVEERLVRFLADPEHEWQALTQAGIAGEFCSQVAARYTGCETLAAAPQEWATGFIASLIATEIYQATGAPGDFPYAALLPHEDRRAAALALLRRWMRDRDYSVAYRRWAMALEKRFDLVSWARGKTGRPQSLRSLAADRWARFLAGLRDQGNAEPALRAYLATQKAAVTEEAKGFWAAGTGDLPGWKLAAELADLAEQASSAATECETPRTAAWLVNRYADQWHRIDLAHWRLLAAAHEAEDTELLARLGDRFYTRYLDAAGRAFYDAFKGSVAWPPADCHAVTGLHKKLYRPSKDRRAILVVDALRYDLAAALRERLREGTLEPYIAAVPTETFVGMTALLPGATVKLALEDGKPALRTPAGGNLNYRTYRWEVLEAAGAATLGKDKKGTRRDQVSDLLEAVDPPKALPNLLVLFTRSIDDVGHPAGHAALHHFDLLLGELERAVRKLRTWGYSEVDVVTDHGFVLLHKDLDVQPLEVDKASLAHMHPRWALAPSGAQTPAAAVPFPLDTDWQIVLPPGLRSFGAPGTFFHGGATLQEAVIPHLHFEWAARRQRMRVTALVPQVEVYALAVKVMLVPELPPAGDLLEGTPEPIQVRVFLGAPDTPCSNEKIVTINSEATDPINVTLFLNREPAIAKGTEIPVQVIDADTQATYASGLFVRAGKDLS